MDRKAIKRQQKKRLECITEEAFMYAKKLFMKKVSSKDIICKLQRLYSINEEHAIKVLQKAKDILSH